MQKNMLGLVMTGFLLAAPVLVGAAEEQKVDVAVLAAQTNSNAVLDLLQVTDGGYETAKSQGGNELLRIKATVKNTHTAPVLPTKFLFYFADTEDGEWKHWLSKISIDDEIKPNASESFEWEFYLSAEQAYLVQQAIAGNMRIMVRTAGMEIGKNKFQRFGSQPKPKDLGNGKWQWENFPAISPKAQWKPVPQATQQAMWDSMKGEAAKLPEHKGKINEKKPVNPTAPAVGKPGRAVPMVLSTDTMSLTAFAPDKKPDTGIRVLALSPSPLVAVRIETTDSQNPSWKTKDVKIKALGVLGVMHNGKLLNAGDASFSLDVSKATPLELVLQDNGSVNDANIRLRVIFFHKDGSRTYSIIEK